MRPVGSGIYDDAQHVQIVPPAPVDSGAFYMVARLSIAVSACLCGACTVMTGNGAGYSYASLGGNAQGLKITPDGASATSIDNSTGMGIAKDAVADAASAWAMGKAFDALGTLVEEGFDAIDSNTAADVKINSSNNAAKVETFVPPPVSTPAP